MLTSIVYWPAARSLSRREASWLVLPPRYSISMPNRDLKASGSLVRASGAGGPLTTTLPSFFAAATSASQSVGPAAVTWAGAVVGAAREGLLEELVQLISARPSEPAPAANASRSIARRL